MRGCSSRWPPTSELRADCAPSRTDWRLPRTCSDVNGLTRRARRGGGALHRELRNPGNETSVDMSDRRRDRNQYPGYAFNVEATRSSRMSLKVASIRRQPDNSDPPAAPSSPRQSVRVGIQSLLTALSRTAPAGCPRRCSSTFPAGSAGPRAWRGSRGRGRWRTRCRWVAGRASPGGWRTGRVAR